MKRISQRALAPVVEQFGIQRTYRAANGERVSASTDTIIAIAQTLGAEVDGDIDVCVRELEDRKWREILDPVAVAWNGQLREIRVRVGAAAARARMDYHIALEDGSTMEGSLAPSTRSVLREYVSGRTRRVELSCSVDIELPAGYHDLQLRTAQGDATALILAAPRKCYAGDRPREWGLFAPLYALRRTRLEAIGDLSVLQDLMQWTAEQGGDVVATLPISAAFLRDPFDPSPYSPASRLFWNELYVAAGDDAHDKTLGAAARAPVIDYRVVADAKRAHIEELAIEFYCNGGARTTAYRDFLKLYASVDEYARFRVNGENRKSGWPVWPQRERDGRLPEFSDDDVAIQYHAYGQFLAHTQLRQLAERTTSAALYLDLPLGVHPDSYDVWRNRDLFVTGASAGAPPDPFFTKGQNWGFPPLHPAAMRKDRYRYWRAVLQTQLRYARLLRLDHVMSLHRLYIVPAGMEASHGAYVRYPHEELYAVLTIESARHNAMIVGEDLGTVPAEVRTSMARHGVKRMFVVQFEAADDPKRPLNEVPADAVASLNTHDMPPFRAYWEALDADLRHELGLLEEHEVEEARAARQRTGRALSQMLGARGLLPGAEARARLLRFLARSRADLLLLNLEDLWLETQPQNVPGTSHERPNWRRRMKYTLDEIRKDSTVQELLDMIRTERRTAQDANGNE